MAGPPATHRTPQGRRGYGRQTPEDPAITYVRVRRTRPFKRAGNAADAEPVVGGTLRGCRRPTHPPIPTRHALGPTGAPTTPRHWGDPVGAASPYPRQPRTIRGRTATRSPLRVARGRADQEKVAGLAWKRNSCRFANVYTFDFGLSATLCVQLCPSCETRTHLRCQSRRPATERAEGRRSKSTV